MAAIDIKIQEILGNCVAQYYEGGALSIVQCVTLPTDISQAYSQLYKIFVDYISLKSEMEIVNAVYSLHSSLAIQYQFTERARVTLGEAKRCHAFEDQLFRTAIDQINAATNTYLYGQSGVSKSVAEQNYAREQQVYKIARLRHTSACARFSSACSAFDIAVLNFHTEISNFLTEIIHCLQTAPCAQALRTAPQTRPASVDGAADSPAEHGSTDVSHNEKTK